MSALTLPVNQLTGIGPAAASQLEKAGIHNLWDLLLTLPIRYEDRTRLSSAADLIPGQPIQLEGSVSHISQLPGRRPQYLVHLNTPVGNLTLRFLNYTKWAHTLPQAGSHIRVFGHLRIDLHGQRELLHPAITRLDGKRPIPLPAHLTAIYPSLGNSIKQGYLRRAIADGLQRLTQTPAPELIPVQSLTLTQALHQLHQPSPSDATALLNGQHPALQRLALEELTARQLLAFDARAQFQHSNAHPLTARHNLYQQLINTLPFQLTSGQQQAWQAIQHDLTQPTPMHRLLQGDVGSGKTVLAALSALQAADAGYQSAIMAPTELLAEQLFQTLRQWLTPLGISCVRHTGSAPAASRRHTLHQIASGQVQVIIGTHALFQDEVTFHDLGLVIVDEQHRFGVEQRLALKAKGQQDKRLPHLLLMTATPIPRTLAMTLYGDLDVSSLTERPPGRQPINTLVMPESKRTQLADRLVQACQQGQQAYWVCPFVSESDTIEAHNVEDTYRWFTSRYPGLRIGLVHGQLPAKDKESRMQAFALGTLDLLIATTVIEVGVNVPNATLMVIDNSERYGLAQLHQLRGRVGRGNQASSCILLYRPPLSDNARSRLHAIRDSQDGFWLAEQDLALRGPGEVLGTRQTGEGQWRIADLLRDTALIPQARQLAEQIYQKHPQQAQQLLSRWLENRLHYTHA